MFPMLKKRTASSASVRNKKRLHLFWSGRVQGVGFRYTAESEALTLKLTGWVQNLPDGRVEAIAEGAEKELKAFVNQVAAGPMRPHIRQTSVDWEPSTGEFNDFRIKFF